MENEIKKIVNFVLVENYAVLEFEDGSISHLNSEILRKTIGALVFIDSSDSGLTEFLKEKEEALSCFCGWGLVREINSSYRLSEIGNRLVKEYSYCKERGESYFL